MKKNFCQECVFIDRPKVPYAGQVPADVMIIGEAPAREELAKGRPFVGESGRVLRYALKVSGVDSYRIFIANTYRCPIYKDKDSTKDLNTAMKQCKQYLNYAIEKVKPKLLVLLGAYALKTITGKTKVMENRGKIFETEYDIPAYATVHPSYSLRKGRNKFYNLNYKQLTPVEKLLIDDFIVIRNILDKGIDEATTIDLSDYKKGTYNDLIEIARHKRIAVDIETDGLGFGNNRKILAISFTWKKGTSRVFIKPKGKILNKINEILANPDIIKIVANRPFDEIMWEKIHGVKWRGIINDVLVLAHIIDENMDSYNLESVANVYSDLRNIKMLAMGKRDNIESMSIEELINYNAVDTDATYRAYTTIANKLKEDKQLLRYYRNFMLPVLDMFADTSSEGFYIDEAELNKSEQELIKIAEDIHNEAINMIPTMLRLKHSNKGLKLSRADLIRDILFDSQFGYKLTPKKFTGKTKRAATDEGHLKEFIGNPFVDKLLRWKKANKIITTYFKQIRKSINEDGKIYPNTLFYQTVTGRTVILNPTIQTIPQRGEFAKYVKRIFKAPDGWKLCSRDLAQSELRIIGWIAGDKNILSALKNGIDLHTKTAAIVNNCKVEDVTKDMRQKAKAVNFGFVYGMSAKSFVRYAKEEYGQEFTLEEAEEIRKNFFAYPNGYYMLPKYHLKMINMARKYGYVSSPLGRKRRLPHINSSDSYLKGEAERQAINFPVQSFSSDLALIGMRLFYDYINDNKLRDKIQLLWFIHDAVLYLSKEDFVEESHKILRYIYREEVPKYIYDKFGVQITYPVESDGKIGDNWAEMEEVE